MKILIAIPTYDRRIDIELFKVIINADRKRKHDFDFIFPVSSHLSRNRNMAVQKTLEGDYDAVLFLDSDIGIVDDEFVDRLVETAYRLDARIVGGAYRMKKPDLSEIVYIAGNYVDGKMENIKKNPQKPVLVESVGTGIMLIFRDVFTKVLDPWFTIVDNQKLDVMPEDFEFCRKAREAGFNIALDPRFETRHYGFYSWTHTP